jgi:hypothetical protein
MDDDGLSCSSCAGGMLRVIFFIKSKSCEQKQDWQACNKYAFRSTTDAAKIRQSLLPDRTGICGSFRDHIG